MNLTTLLPLLLIPVLGTQPLPRVDGATFDTLAAAEPAAVRESVVELYDLRALGLRRQNIDGEYLLLPASIEPQNPFITEYYDLLDIDQVMDLISRLCGDEFEFEGRALWSSDDQVLGVRAPAAVQARIAKLLELLADSMGRRIELRVDIINHPTRIRVDDSFLGIIDAESAEQLRRGAAGSGVTQQSFNLYLAPGEPSRLDVSRFHELVAWYDTEVAQSSFAFDPVVVDLVSGTRLSMTGAPVEGGLGLSVVVRSGDPNGPPERVDLSQRGFASNENSRGFLEGPRFAQTMSIATRSYAFDTAIPDGKALSFQSTLSVDGAQGTQIIVVQPQGESIRSLYSVATAGTEADVYVVNTNAFSPPRLGFGGSGSWMTSGGLRPDRIPIHDEPLITVFSAEVDDGSAWEYLESQRQDLVFEGASNWIVATRDPQTTAELNEAGITPLSLEDAVRAMTQRPESVQLSLKLSRSGEGLSRGLNCDLPLRVGQTSVISLGVEGLYIRDFDVEIAQGSTASNPVANLYLDGLALMIVPRRSPNGDLSLELRGIAQLLREREFFEPSSPMYRGMDQLLFDRLVIDQVVSLGQGTGSLTLGDSSKNAPIGSLRLDLQVR